MGMKEGMEPWRLVLEGGEEERIRSGCCTCITSVKRESDGTIEDVRESLEGC